MKPVKAKHSAQLYTVLMTSITFWAGAMAFYDFPQIYSDFLMEYFIIDPVQLEYMYSFVHIPNIFLAIGASFIVNKIGYANSVIFCQLIIILGLLICMQAVHARQFIFMIIGRAVFGLGCETSYVAQSGVTDLWFSGKFLSLAYSLNSMVTYLFQTGSIIVLPNLYLKKEDMAEKKGDDRIDSIKIGFTWVLSGNILLVVFVLACSLIYKVIETKRNRRLKRIAHMTKGGLNESLINSEQINLDDIALGNDRILRKFKFRDVKRMSGISWAINFYFCFIGSAFYMFTTFATELFIKRFGFTYR